MNWFWNSIDCVALLDSPPNDCDVDVVVDVDTVDETEVPCPDSFSSLSSSSSSSFVTSSLNRNSRSTKELSKAFFSIYGIHIYMINVARLVK